MSRRVNELHDNVGDSYLFDTWKERQVQQTHITTPHHQITHRNVISHNITSSTSSTSQQAEFSKQFNTWREITRTKRANDNEANTVLVTELFHTFCQIGNNPHGTIQITELPILFEKLVSCV